MVSSYSTYKRAEFVENFANWGNSFDENDNPTPKSLGFVVLSPTITLTLAGIELVEAKRKEEIFLRQLLKFQIPSPYHKPTENSVKGRKFIPPQKNEPLYCNRSKPAGQSGMVMPKENMISFKVCWHNAIGKYTQANVVKPKLD